MKFRFQPLATGCIVGAFALGLLLAGCKPAPKTTVTAPEQVSAWTLAAPPADSVLFSFAFVGCNRIDGKDVTSPFTNASTANVPQLQRTFAEIAGLQPRPSFFFFLGDLVLGLEQDSAVLGGQLAAWVQQYQDTSFSPLAMSGIQLVAIPGNHEMLYMEAAEESEKAPSSGKKQKKPKGTEVPWPGAISTWMQHMGAFMPTQPLNRVSGPDSLYQLQTYSFDFQNTHFIVLNTDTWNEAEAFGQFPVDWVTADIAAARANAATKHIILLSHKPAYVVPDKAADDVMDTTLRAQLWPAMVNAKAEALLSAHSHQYYRTQPLGQPSFQIVAGNGGSPYVGGLTSENQFMGFSVVYVMKNGDLLLQSWGRDMPASNYLDSIPASDATTLRDEINMRWKD